MQRLGGHALPGDQHTRACAARLTGLLIERPDYRARWQAQMRRHSGVRVHQGAVAQVLAAYLWDAGLASDGDVDLPRRLKHTVSRAFSGRVLAPVTLGWFVEAFAMSPVDAAELWALRVGSDPARLSVVRAAPIGSPASTAQARYETIALHEFHTVGSDGLPQEHRTVHLVRAIEEMAKYTYRFDTNAAAVEVIRGGTAGPLYLTDVDGLHAVDITFARPLVAGQTGSFEYRTLFRYGSAPPTQFRRAVRHRATNVEIHVQFQLTKLPRSIAWAIWDDHRSETAKHQEFVRLDPDGAVHRYLEVVEAHAVGFVWRF